ncbi:uncharacterized protein LAESUDRAFT_711819 [Laetiporus sulphureus 93-53]|uniref:Uncharacterized protein n=1 Tax=Laetiporus sulphureus 93-53 TaxID=1314785 RepID=A0A165G8A0_9APHY|nr:uncharacterized protein LAESUDRAFT_711819 [Laetiporus sulphureus 93-53]KZT09966.1 hypothetical protein LAESUDRAFT_711819 [Laetiporus sulphureus 93-53]
MYACVDGLSLDSNEQSPVVLEWWAEEAHDSTWRNPMKAALKHNMRTFKCTSHCIHSFLKISTMCTFCLYYCAQTTCQHHHLATSQAKTVMIWLEHQSFFLTITCMPMYKCYQDTLLQHALQGCLSSSVTMVSSSSTAHLPAVTDMPSFATLPGDLDSEVNMSLSMDYEVDLMKNPSPDVVTHAQADLGMSPIIQDVQDDIDHFLYSNIPELLWSHS